MSNCIIINKNQADQLRGRYGRYSAIDPIGVPDNTFIIPMACFDAPDLKSARAKLDSMLVSTNIENIRDLPAEGEQCYQGEIYNYSSEDYPGSKVKCVQDHVRTIYPPEDTPALFTFFRENSPALEWIPNEWIEIGWIRVYNGTQYEALQSFMTVTGQTPDIVPALWKSLHISCPEWVQPTGAHDAYNTGDCVTFNGSEYKSLIDANVWSPAVYPTGWQLQ